MTDRQPGAPGQYTLSITASQLEALLAGSDCTVTLTRDDHPLVEGTPYNKASVLPDELAALLCPGVADPTPADALAALQSWQADVAGGSTAVGKAKSADSAGTAANADKVGGYAAGTLLRVSSFNASAGTLYTVSG